MQLQSDGQKAVRQQCSHGTAVNWQRGDSKKWIQPFLLDSTMYLYMHIQNDWLHCWLYETTIFFITCIPISILPQSLAFQIDAGAIFYPSFMDNLVLFIAANKIHSTPVQGSKNSVRNELLRRRGWLSKHPIIGWMQMTSAFPRDDGLHLLSGWVNYQQFTPRRPAQELA